MLPTSRMPGRGRSRNMKGIWWRKPADGGDVPDEQRPDRWALIGP
jgi:hypothetical protein